MGKIKLQAHTKETAFKVKGNKLTDKTAKAALSPPILVTGQFCCYVMHQFKDPENSLQSGCAGLKGVLQFLFCFFLQS